MMDLLFVPSKSKLDSKKWMRRVYLQVGNFGGGRKGHRNFTSTACGYSASWRQSNDNKHNLLEPPDPATYLKGFDEVPETALYKNALFQAMDVQPGHRILDVGCGTATHIPLYSHAVGAKGSVMGVDLSSSMIQEATAKYSNLLHDNNNNNNNNSNSDTNNNVHFQVANVYDLPFDASSFHVVKEDRVLEHLIRPLEAVQEMLRVTKPGGCVVVGNPDFRSFTLDLPSQPWGKRKREQRRRPSSPTSNVEELDQYALMTKLLNGVIPTLASHSSMGLQLPRLLRAAGCSHIELQIVPLPLIGRDNLEKIVPISYMARLSEANGAITAEERTLAMARLLDCEEEGDNNNNNNNNNLLLGAINMYICRGVKPGSSAAVAQRPAIGHSLYENLPSPPPKDDVHIRLATPQDNPDLIEQAVNLVNNEYATSDTGVTLSSTRLRPQDIQSMVQNGELLLAFDDPPTNNKLLGCVQVKFGGGLPSNDDDGGDSDNSKKEVVAEFTCLAVASDVVAKVTNANTQQVTIDRTTTEGTASSNRGRGIGAALVRKAEALARNMGATKMLLAIMCPAHGEKPAHKAWLEGYYQSLGYEYQSTLLLDFEIDSHTGEVVVDELHDMYEPLYQLVQCNAILYDKQL